MVSVLARTSRMRLIHRRFGDDAALPEQWRRMRSSAAHPLTRPCAGPSTNTGATAIAAVRRCGETDPHGWADYIAEPGRLAGADAALTDDTKAG
jgi:hypothetical protein